MLHRSIELHDSTLAAIVRRERAFVMQLRPAYIHASAGTPGVDAGDGFHQDIDLLISEATLPSSLPELNVWIADGTVHRNASKLENDIPIPFVLDEPFELELLLANSEQFSVRGERLEVAAHGEPKWIEKYR